MAIATYDDLVAEIADWLQNSDLTAKAPTFIQLAEARFNRLLFNMDDEQTVTTSTVADQISYDLPTRFKKMRSLSIATNPPHVLGQLSVDDLQRKWANATAANPVNYALAGGELQLGPAPGDVFTLTMVYIEGFDALASDNQTNWLLLANPDLYLYSALVHAEARGWNDERLPMLKAGADEMIGEIRNADAIRRKGDFVGEVAGTYF